MKLIHMLKTEGDAQIISDAANPPEPKASKPVVLLQDGSPKEAPRVSAQAADMLRANDSNSVLDRVLLSNAGDGGSNPERIIAAAKLLPGIKAEFVDVFSEPETSLRVHKAAEIMASATRLMLFSSLAAFAEGTPLSYQFLDLMLGTAETQAMRNILLVSSAPEFLNISPDDSITDVSFADRYALLKSANPELLASLMSNQMLAPGRMKQPFVFTSRGAWKLTPKEFAGKESQDAAGNTVRDIDYQKVWDKLANYYKSDAQDEDAGRTSPLVYNAGRESVYVPPLPRSSIYKETAPSAVRMKPNASVDDPNVYPAKPGSGNSKEIDPGRNALYPALNGSMDSYSYLEKSLRDLRAMYDATIMLPTAGSDNRPSIVLDNSGGSGKAKFGSAYFAWAKGLGNLDGWKDLGGNLASNALNYGEQLGMNVVNSTMSAVSGFASAIPGMANDLVLGVTKGAADWAMGLGRGLLGLSDGRDKQGRSVLLKDAQWTRLKPAGQEYDKETALAPTGLRKFTAAAERAFSNAWASMKNTLLSTVGASLEDDRRSGHNDRFDYYRVYSSAAVDTNAYFPVILNNSEIDQKDLKGAAVDRIFYGYGNLANLSARIDRFYDFNVLTPPPLEKKGLPPFNTNVTNGYKVWDMLSFSNRNKDAPPLDISPRSSFNVEHPHPMEHQADIEGFSGVSLSSGERMSLGSFGEMCTTSQINMVSRISMVVVEDEYLSVRNWMDSYLAYMYDPDFNKEKLKTYEGRMDAFRWAPGNFSPNLSRPIFQGYYAIEFRMLDSMRSEVLRRRYYYAVPRFDLSMQPIPSAVRTFQIQWEVIGEEGLFGK